MCNKDQCKCDEINIKEYQDQAYVTLNKEMPVEEQVKNCCFGLAGEVGETVDILKKHFYHGHDLNHDKLKKEIGDVSWYLVNLVTTLNEYTPDDVEYDIADILQMNINKLKKRYEGEFSCEKSMNRPD